jgi:formylglycine-generating enzyme required for sulfatase activity
MKSNRNLWLVFVLVFWAFGAQGNNVQISNVRLTGDNPGEGYVLVTFDLSWENSWRTNVGPSNWDAVWLFVKFQVDGGEWRHAWLHESGHSGGSGTASTMELGLRDDKLAFNAETNPGIGMMVYRSALGSGTFSATDVQLRWNYSVQGVAAGSVVKADVFGIEMVLVPGGEFWVGDGVSRGSFRQAADNIPFQVTTTGGILRAAADGCCDDSQIKGDGIWVDGDGGISPSAATETNLNTDYPTGFRGFYCMKYEITQGQYRDFLNTLMRDQQNGRSRTDISVTIVTNRYVMSGSSTLQSRNGLRCDGSLPADGPIEVYCDLDGDGVKNESNDGEWVACNWLNWEDGSAYMDWSGLRPMTELEYEKACRGPGSSVGGEYAWGTTGIAGSIYTLSSAGESVEGIRTNYSTTAGNALYGSTYGSILGPARVGIFAANTLNTGRIASGSGFYGAMELSGNLLERSVTLGNATGRNYTGLHGDGLLGSTGNADVPAWPGTDAVGAGIRDGGGAYDTTHLRVSDRIFGASWASFRDPTGGFRGCRGVGVSGGGY